MWLLNAATRRLEYFQGRKVPDYAIVTHRWEDDEVSFDEIQADIEFDSTKAGHRKVLMSCRQTLQDSLQYVWLDTCCVDRRSSAELSEAVNGMYNWYAQAKACYGYLFDVDELRDLELSSWFTRSWTLQELLAPPEIIFYNREWKSLGSKSGLLSRLSKITKIPRAALVGFKADDYSVAAKMTWAANRSATRIEDEAYSLFGVFDINMPLLYGEGKRAFQRLQEAIMSETNDFSIFMWTGEASKRFGMLAESPSSFMPRDITTPVTPSAARDDFGLEKMPVFDGININSAGVAISANVAPYRLLPGHRNLFAAIIDVQTLETLSSYVIFVEQDIYTSIYYRARTEHGMWTTVDDPSLKMREPCLFSGLTISRSPVSVCTDGSDCSLRIEGCANGVVLYQRPTLEERRDKHEQLLWSRHTVATDDNGSDIVASDNLATTIQSDDVYGMCGYLSWENSMTSPYLIIFYGFDFFYRPICLAFMHKVSNCTQPMEGLTTGTVMGKYSSMMPNDSDRVVMHDPKSGLSAFRFKNAQGVRDGLVFTGTSSLTSPELGLTISFKPRMEESTPAYTLKIDYAGPTLEPRRLPTHDDIHGRFERIERLFDVTDSSFAQIPDYLYQVLNLKRSATFASDPGS